MCTLPNFDEALVGNIFELGEVGVGLIARKLRIPFGMNKERRDRWAPAAAGAPQTADAVKPAGSMGVTGHERTHAPHNGANSSVRRSIVSRRRHPDGMRRSLERRASTNRAADRQLGPADDVYGV